jgi:hypothetical protein
MSADIASLLMRNLYDVFGERDPILRSAAIEMLLASDIIFSDPHGRHIGHAALDDAVSALHAQFPDYRFSALGEADALEDCGRLAWAFGPAGDPQRITGLDIAVVGSGRITALYTFLNTRA